MYERVSQEQPRADTLNFNFQDVSVEDLDLHPHGNAIRPEESRADDVPNTSISDTTDSASHKPAKDHDHVTQDVGAAPATLQRTAFQQWFPTLIDLVLSMFPLFFLVIAAICLSLNAQPVSSFGEDIKAITLLSPTIFPIVYAAILGKMLRRIGLFKAERSATIGTLERFVGSQNLFATIERQFALRRIDFLGVAIVLAWLLSPLGGQSSLRLLSTTSRFVEFETPIKYFPAEGFANRTYLSIHMEEGPWPQYAPLYMTALQTSQQSLFAPMDLFGGVKIPDITLLDGYDESSVHTNDWYNVSSQNEIAYTSMLGIPLIDIPVIGNSSFDIVSSYWDIECSPFWVPTYEEWSALNISAPGLSPGPKGPTFSLNAKGVNLTTLLEARKVEAGFGYWSKRELSSFTNTTCMASLRLVESNIGCDSTTCSVQRIRHSDRDMAHMLGIVPGEDNDYNLYYNWVEYFRELCDFMPGADLGYTQSMVVGSELVEQWIADPYLTNYSTGDGRIWTKQHVELANLTSDVFSRRLTTAINTFWDATIGLQYRKANLTTDVAERGKATSRTIAWNTTTASGTRYEGEKYVCNTAFAVTTIAISWLLFMAATVSLILGVITKAPDILGYVSTTARDDPYFSEHVPSHLDGLQAARKLRDVRVRIGDVHKEDDVGHVAFASMDTGPERVSKKRLYD